MKILHGDSCCGNRLRDVDKAEVEGLCGFEVWTVVNEIVQDDGGNGTRSTTQFERNQISNIVARKTCGIVGGALVQTGDVEGGEIV